MNYLIFTVLACLISAAPSYAVSIMYSYQTNAEIAADAATIKGMNIDVLMNITNPEDMTVAGLTTYLNTLQSVGLKGMICLYTVTEQTTPDYSTINTVVAALKNHPALYAWYTYDEPQTKDYPSAVRTSVYNYIKAIDSSHPIMVVFPSYGTTWWPDSRTSDYVTTDHDLFGGDNYPVYTGGSYNSSTFQSLLTGAYNSTVPGDRGNLIGIIQSYGGAGQGIPTTAQMNSMAGILQSTGWNAKGIAFWIWKINPALYSGLSTATFLRDIPTLWPAVTSIAATYHENLYPPPTAAASTATTRASFR